MHILQSWKESLALFKPSNFKLFLMVSARSFALALKTMLLYWGWLIFLFWTYHYALSPAISQQWHIEAILRAVLLFIFICCLRPSSSLKNISYFAKKFCKFWLALLITVGLYVLDSQLLELNVIFDTSFYLCFSLGVTLYLLFTLDSNGSLKNLILSAYRALKMLLYNLPWFLIIAFVFTVLEIAELGISMLLAHYSSGAAVLVHNVLQGLIYGFHSTLLANFYLKRLYDQIDLYFTHP